MQVLAWILLVSVVHNLAMMIIDPLLTIRKNEKLQNKKALHGRYAAYTWLWRFVSVQVSGYLLHFVGGKESILDPGHIQALNITSWVIFPISVGVVIFGFIKASRLRKQEQAHQLG